jgi:hypothetical protein
VWSALIVGAVGALIASQMLGKSTDEATDTAQSDPSADA